MKTQKALSLGWIVSLIFILGTFILGSLLEGYNPVSQTISEIGQKGSPLYLPWQVFSISIGVLIIFFAVALINFARNNKLSILPGIFMLAYGLSQFGIGFYPSPHQLHNVFGLSMTIGYFSPLVFALAWKNKLGKSFKTISLVVFLLIVFAIFLNLTPAFAPTLYPLEYYGIVQRFLLFTFFGYCAIISVHALKYEKHQALPLSRA